ncbi:hypothetical protein [Pyxidicoccus fallax]|nr:hypothetical protein [Pyxidicoccus fallax]
MKARSLTASFLLAATLGGCAESDPVPPVPTGLDAPVTELPASQAAVSGLVFDPEAFLAMYLAIPNGEGPPAYLLPGMPGLMYSAIPDARVRLYGPGLRESLSPPSSPAGQWQADGVALDEHTPYLAEAVPPQGPVTFYIDEYAPLALPPATYYPTTHVRPIQVSGTQCSSQTALMVGSAGALDAVAQHLTAGGTPTTVEDLLNPARTGGVVLLNVHTPSFFYDFFLTPMDEVAVEASAGTVVALDWAYPEGLPGQSPMGYSVIPGSVSPVGYFALVLPPGASAPVTVSFTDTVVTPPEEEPGEFGPRPVLIPSATVEPRAGVSVQRVFAWPNFPPFEPDPLEDPPLPPMDESWHCVAPEPPPEG